MEPLPIETAPKDGTEILVYDLWAGEINGVDDEPGWYVASYSTHTDHPGFEWCVVGTDAYAAWVRATHWAPLPEPPKC